ncbi:glucosyl-dolichyl phosphate glucuronosyltransferase [Natronorarus salvus]|uniref:glucosyl-dolichyl phosphate glucuronosyltransferase n=1 Tax=Natronorarus salvus TaxID=3117733 RepID=UPI002F26477B
MRVSVVINTYSEERYDAFARAVESVLAQSHDDLELVLVSDGNEAAADRARADFGGHEDVIVHCTEENLGNSGARTVGAALASGDVIAVTDDDTRAEPDWIEELVRVYEETDAIAVGGIVVPEWVAGKPEFLPEEFYWLIGCNHRGFGDHGEEVRNTFGCNLSFRAEVFDELGGFSTRVGRVGEKQLQGHETEICARMHERFGRGVHYTTDAVVHHSIFEYRTDPIWLLRRAFWQGYSKRIMHLVLPGSSGGEGEFLERLATEFVPERVRRLVRSPSVAGVKQLVAIVAFTLAVGLGYLYGFVRFGLYEEFSNRPKRAATS